MPPGLAYRAGMGKERRTYADRRAYLLAYEAKRVAVDAEYRDRRRRHKREWAARSRAIEKGLTGVKAP